MARIIDLNLSEKDFYAEIIKIFSEKLRLFPSDRGADARELARLQSIRWNDLLSKFERQYQSSENQLYKNIVKQLSVIRIFISKNSVKLFRTMPQPDAYALVGGIPILNENIDFTNTIDDEYILAAIFSEALIPIRDELINLNENTIELDVPIPSFLHLKISKYISDRAVYDDARRINLEKANSDLRKIVKAASTEQHLADSNRIKNQQDFESEIAHIREQGEAELSKIGNIFEDFLAKATDKIEAARALAHEATTLESATQIWARKYKKHNIVFSLVAFFLAAAVIVVTFYLISNFSTIKTSIPTKTDGDIAYGFILLILIPIIAVAWVVRIFTRRAINSLILSEDAEQRQAMIETYLRLVADPHAKMEQADRIIVLNALFRALPGTSQEDISPPTIADFLKDAISVKK